MEYAFLVLILLILYLVRDAELLCAASGGKVGKRLIAYGLGIGLAVVMGVLIANAPTLGAYLRRIRQSDVIKPLLLFQLGIWFHYAWLLRTKNLRDQWTVAVVPSPVLILCLVGVSVSIRASALWPALPVAFSVVAVWIGVVAFWTRWTMRSSGDDPAWRSGLVSISNGLIVMLLPFENILAEARDLMRMILAHD